MSSPDDEKVLADVQSRFEVSIATLPEQIDVSAYSILFREITLLNSEHLKISHCFTIGSITQFHVCICYVLFLFPQ